MVNKKTCQTCKYWEDCSDNRREVPDIGICNAVEQYVHATEFYLNTSNSISYALRRLRKSHEKKLAFVEDSDFDVAVFRTHKNFGCVSWKKRENNNLLHKTK